MFAWLNLRRVLDKTHEYNYSIAWANHTLWNSNKQLLLWKIPNASIKDFLFVDIRNKLNSLTSRFRSGSSRFVLTLVYRRHFL